MTEQQLVGTLPFAEVREVLGSCACAWALIDTLAGLSFADARPRGNSDIDFIEADGASATCFATSARFERGRLHFSADHVRGRMMKTTIDIDGGVCRATARIPGGSTVAAPPVPDWATRPMSLSGEVPAALATVPVLPVSDLTAAVGGLRALGFEVTETAAPRIAAAGWPGLLIELIEAPSTQGAACHIVVESIDALAAIWSAARIEFRRLEAGDDGVLLVEVPGGLTLTFGASLPPGYRPATKRRKPSRARVRRTPAP